MAILETRQLTDGTFVGVADVEGYRVMYIHNMSDGSEGLIQGRMKLNDMFRLCSPYTLGMIIGLNWPIRFLNRAVVFGLDA